MRFSANLGLLWGHLPLVERIRRARTAGFDAVECHWPYDTPATLTRQALDDTGLPMLGLNTSRGKVDAGENGLCALPGRDSEARAAIDQAIAYAHETRTSAVHVMAGNSSGPRARSVFVANLDYACRSAARLGIRILIEPLNAYDAPNYYLHSTDLAADIIREVGHSNLRLIFDCYHVQIMQGDVTRRLEALLPLIGHFQIVAVPDRGPPDHGELNYDHVLAKIEDLGWDRPIGAEYVSPSGESPDLAWLSKHRGQLISGAQQWATGS